MMYGADDKTLKRIEKGEKFIQEVLNYLEKDLFMFNRNKKYFRRIFATETIRYAFWALEDEERLNIEDLRKFRNCLYKEVIS